MEVEPGSAELTATLDGMSRTAKLELAPDHRYFVAIRVMERWPAPLHPHVFRQAGILPRVDIDWKVLSEADAAKLLGTPERAR